MYSSLLWMLQFQSQGTILVGFWWELSSLHKDSYLFAVAPNDKEEDKRSWRVSFYKGNNPTQKGSNLRN
jgi:hypothetical protein